MLKMPFSNWSDFYTSAGHFDNKIASLDVLNLLNVAFPDESAANLKEQDTLAALIEDNISGDLLFFHNIARIGKYLKKKPNNKKENA